LPTTGLGQPSLDHYVHIHTSPSFASNNSNPKTDAGPKKRKVTFSSLPDDNDEKEGEGERAITRQSSIKWRQRNGTMLFELKISQEDLKGGQHFGSVVEGHE